MLSIYMLFKTLCRENMADIEMTIWIVLVSRVFSYKYMTEHV